MKFTADIQIIPLPEIYEPQGQTVLQHLHKLQIKGVEQMRIGKYVALELEAQDEAAAQKTIEQICQKLLAHPLVETYSFHLKAVAEPIAEVPEPPTEEETPAKETNEAAITGFTSNSSEEEEE